MKKITVALLLGLFMVAGCGEDVDPTASTKTFTRFFDDNRFNEIYYPIDAAQTPDGGYLVLSGKRIEGSNFRGIHLLKTDKAGNLEESTELNEQYVNAIGDLMEIAGTFYFFAMDAASLQAQLVAVQEDLGSVTITALNTATYYPAAASVDNSSMVLLSYDHLTKESVLSIVSQNGSVQLSQAFSIGAGDDVEEPIIDHFIHTGRQFPFQTGKAGSLYFFNGFYNYTFSLVFVNLGQTAPAGVVQGQQDDGGFSAVKAISSGFAASRFNFGENYFLPVVNLTTSGISSSVDLGGNPLPELEANATVAILPITINGQSSLVFAGNTRSKQIGLYFYDAVSGEFRGSHYLGFSNPFELASIRTTDDGGIIVCGTTYLAGRFPRISLFKLSKETVSAAGA